jgi:hypothetical protein
MNESSGWNTRAIPGVKQSMDSCHVCARPLDGAALSGVHPQCVAERLPGDLAVAVFAALAVVLAPALVVWAG